MIKRAVNISAVCGAYIATLIGAGFASGQEIMNFFIKYGNVGFFGVIIVSAIFGVVAYEVLKSASDGNFKSFKNYLVEILPEWLVGVVNFIVFIFMMAVFCVMAAGCGATLSQYFGISNVVGVGSLCVVCWICFLFDVDAVLAVNGILSPIIVFGIVFVCVYILKFRDMNVFLEYFKTITDNWIVSGMSYASYNVLTAVVVLVEIGAEMKDSKDAKWIGVISGIIFFVILSLMWVVLRIYSGKIELGEVPMLTLAIRQGRIFGGLYAAVLLAAMITTAISNGFGVAEYVCERLRLSKKVGGAMVCSVGFLGAGIGFERLVGEGYNACGYVGAVLLFAILKNFIIKLIKRRKIKKNREITYLN